MDFNYDEAFKRNIGVVTQDEQNSVSNTVVALAGVGGIGGSTLLCLVRMGFQNFKIADLDKFDMGNSNRQVGATLETYNRTKVEVMKEMALGINPQCKIEVFGEGVQEHNVDDFLKGAHVVIDCIDFFCMTARTLLHQKARENKLNVFMSAPMGLSATVIGFSPEGLGFMDYLNLEPGDDKFTQVLKFLIGLAPKATHAKYVDFSVEKISKIKTGPSIANAVNLGVALLTNEVLMSVTKRREPMFAPHTLQIDMYLQRYEKVKIGRGNKSLIQRLKLYFAAKKYASARKVFNEFIV